MWRGTDECVEVAVGGNGESLFCRGGGCWVGAEGSAGEERGWRGMCGGQQSFGEGVWGCSQE